MIRRSSFAALSLLFLLLLSACTPGTTAAATSTSHPRATASPSNAASLTSPSPSATPSAFISTPTPLKLAQVASTSQAEPIHEARDISYAQIKGIDPKLLSLDVYYTGEVTLKHPVMLFIHGGGWVGGDKAHVGFKPEAFTQAGYVFISANYQLSPQAVFPTHVQDVARAIAWVVKNIRTYGGDPERIFLMGHSAGGHLATLIATDDEYLKSIGLSLSTIKGVISLDTAADDISVFASQCKNHILPEPYSIPFGQDPAVWKFASPATYLKAGKGIPPIAVIYSGDAAIGSTVTRQSLAEEFEAKLVSAKIPTVLFGALDKNHAGINDDFGKPGDKISAETLTFLKKIDSAGK
jgi:arylformamidase